MQDHIQGVSIICDCHTSMEAPVREGLCSLRKHALESICLPGGKKRRGVGRKEKKNSEVSSPGPHNPPLKEGRLTFIPYLALHLLPLAQTPLAEKNRISIST